MLRDLTGLLNSDEEDDSREQLVTNAVIVACVIGIIIVAALIVVTPREKEQFTQLWLKPWKLNLTNATEENPHLEELLNTLDVGDSKILNGTVLGRPFYVVPEISTVLYVPDKGIPFWAKKGETLYMDSVALYVDAIDENEGQILFWEYPRTLSPRIEKIDLEEPDLQDIPQSVINLEGADGKILKEEIFNRTLYLFKSHANGDFKPWFVSENGLKIERAQNISIFLLSTLRKEAYFWIEGKHDPYKNLVRYSFVIENNLGRNKTYDARVVLQNEQGNVTKVKTKIFVHPEQQKTCLVSFQLTDEEKRILDQGNRTKIATQLDTGEEVFFWLGSSSQ